MKFAAAFRALRKLKMLPRPLMRAKALVRGGGSYTVLGEERERESGSGEVWVYWRLSAR